MGCCEGQSEGEGLVQGAGCRAAQCSRVTCWQCARPPTARMLLKLWQRWLEGTPQHQNKPKRTWAGVGGIPSALSSSARSTGGSWSGCTPYSCIGLGGVDVGLRRHGAQLAVTRHCNQTRGQPVRPSRHSAFAQRFEAVQTPLEATHRP